MFGLFKTKKPHIDFITIPTFNLNNIENNESVKDWINDERSILLSLNLHNKEPNIPTTKDANYLRSFFRDQIIQSNGGLVNLSLIKICGINSIKTIFKVPNQPSGMVYLGTIIIPFKKCSYTIKIQAVETGTTGVRDSIMLNKYLSEGKVQFGDSGIKGWSEDPYDANYKKGTLMNKSELEIHDSDFENHPLTKLRVMFKEIETKIKLDVLLEKQKRFEY